MSPLARRITIALFLILLAIPVAYVVLSWRLQASLEFQAASYRPNSEIQPPGHMGSRGIIEVLIANKSSFPIRYYMGTLQRDTNPSESSAALNAEGDLGQFYVTIPPRRFVRATVSDWDPRDQKGGGIHGPGLTVQYYWTSSARGWWIDFQRWLQGADPMLPPVHNLHNDSAPLIPPPDSATVEP